MNNKNIFILLAIIGIGILGIGGLLMINNNKQKDLNSSLPTRGREKEAPLEIPKKKNTPSPFSINTAPSYQVAKGEVVTIPIEVKGVSPKLGISGVAVKVAGVPSGATNPAMVIDGENWTVSMSESKKGEITFVSNNPGEPLTEDNDSFITLSFFIDEPQSAQMTVEVELDDTATPSMPHKMTSQNIQLTQLKK